MACEGLPEGLPDRVRRVGVAGFRGGDVGVRQRLRGIEVFARPLPRFGPEQAPAEPVALFLGWLAEAVAAGFPTRTP